MHYLKSIVPESHCDILSLVLDKSLLFSAECAGEKFHRRIAVRMGIRVVQRAYVPVSPSLLNICGPSVFGPKDRTKAAKHNKIILSTRSPRGSAGTAGDGDDDAAAVGHPQLKEQPTIEENEPNVGVESHPEQQFDTLKNNRKNAKEFEAGKPEIVLSEEEKGGDVKKCRNFRTEMNGNAGDSEVGFWMGKNWLGLIWCVVCFYRVCLPSVTFR